jgi:hypothetical protein
LINSEGFEVESPLRLRLQLHLQCYMEEKFFKKLPASPLSPLSSTSSVLRSQYAHSPDETCTNQKQTTIQPHVTQAQYTNNSTKFIQDSVSSIQNDLRFFNCTLTPASYQPQFAIPNYSQNAIKISNYYNISNESTLRPSNYWNNSIASLQWSLWKPYQFIKLNSFISFSLLKNKISCFSVSITCK